MDAKPKKPRKPVNLSFLDSYPINEELRKNCEKLRQSRELKIIAFDKIYKLAKSNPKDDREAALLFYRIKENLDLIID